MAPGQASRFRSIGENKWRQRVPLNITSQNVNAPENQAMIISAFEVANKGTCIDEAFYVANALANGGDPKEIDEQIKTLREEI